MINIHLVRQLRNHFQVREISLKHDDCTIGKRYQFQRQYYSLKYHPYVQERLKLSSNKSSNEEESTKIIEIPKNRPNVIKDYYKDGKFIFKGEILTSKEDFERIKSENQTVRECNQLKFIHDIDNADEFLERFKKITTLLDDTQKKLEFLRFFKPEHRIVIQPKLSSMTIIEMMKIFFEYYKGKEDSTRQYYESLDYENSKSLERFLLEKFHYFNTYLKLSLEAIKIQLLFCLPETLSIYLNLNQPTLSNQKSVIDYVCLKAKEIKLIKPIYKVEEGIESTDEMSERKFIDEIDRLRMKYPRKKAKIWSL